MGAGSAPADAAHGRGLTPRADTQTANAGPTVGESYEIDDFDALDVDNAWEVIVEIGPEASFEIDVSEDHLDDVNVDSSDGRLSLSMDGSGWFSLRRGTQVARVTTPSLRELTVDGAAEVEIDGLSGDEFDLDLNGASSVDLGSMDLDRLDLALNGASSVVGVGRSETVTIDADGASSVEFGDVTIGEVEVDASGASSMDLTGADSVSGRLSGASSVDVADDASTSVRTSGASSVD